MTFKRLAYTMAAVAVSCCPSDAARSELIVNGSFEEPVLSSSFSIFPTIPGWSGGEGGIEIQGDRVGGFTARGIADGEQFAELDTVENSLMFQDVSTRSGETYLLSFAYAPRQLDTRPLDSNDIAVSWEGISVALLGGPSEPSAFRQEEWENFSYTVMAASETGFSRLQFEARGASDSKGGLIDRVSLVQVPEPSTRVLMTLGIGAVALRCRPRFRQP